MRLALGVPCWQDGRELLEQTVASVGGIEDVLIIADGLIDGVDACGLDDISSLEDFAGVPADTIGERRRWVTQSAKRDWMLTQARESGCDWLLQIDTDERLHQPEMLRDWLEVWPYACFPLPFEPVPGGPLIGASWKCIRVAAWSEIVAQGAYLRSSLDGQIYCLVPPEGMLPPGYVDGLPWLSHHPELRAAGRREIRLSTLEDRLEPPNQLGEWLPFRTPGFAARPTREPDGSFFCDQCGRRYLTPGVCDLQHPASVVHPVQARIAA